MKKILVVDDEDIMLMITRRILSAKYDVVTASTGAEAIELFEREQPDMVLSDLLMPEMDGYELHRLLQERSENSVPIMFMTADESTESESRGFEAGAADYIRKPFQPQILLRRVENILNNAEKIHGLKTAATTDPLTKMPNKSAVQNQIGELVAKTSGALLMIDLDSFKLVNDLYGHAAGDKILIHFAENVRKIIRANDVAGRIGGDEFLAFLQNVHDEKILRDKTDFLNAEILRDAKKIMGTDMQIPLGVSVGAVFVPDAGRNFAALKELADKSLYDVKQHGKHGLAVFGAHIEAEKFSATESFSQIRQILGERNVTAGAYMTDFDTFKKIYRLFVRMENFFPKGVVLMQFTLNTDEFAEEFEDVLINSLRQSDCVTRNGKNFLVLLPDTAEEESELVRDRIFSRMKKIPADEISFARERIF